MSELQGEANITKNQQTNPQMGESQIKQPHHRNWKEALLDKAKTAAGNALRSEAGGLLNSVVNRVAPVGMAGIGGRLVNEGRQAVNREVNNKVNNAINTRLGMPDTNGQLDNTQRYAGQPATAGQDRASQSGQADTIVRATVQKPAVSDAMRNPSPVTDTSGSMQVDANSLYKKVEVKPQTLQASGDATQAATHKAENHGFQFHDYHLNAVSQAGADSKNATQATGKLEAPHPVKFNDYSQTKTNDASGQTGKRMEYIPGQGIYDVYPDGTRKVHSVSDN